MKVIIYVLLTVLCVDGARNINSNGENSRNLITFRTNVRTCPDNSECNENDDCERFVQCT